MEISPTERTQGLSPPRAHSAAEELRVNGFVVLEDCLPRDFVASLRDELLAALEQKRKKLGVEPCARYSLLDQAGKGGNHGYNRWNIRLPSRLPFLDERLIANPAALSVIRQFYDRTAILSILACDVNMPRSAVQQAHRDRGDFSLIVNVPLVDMTVENGATQIFPGTHRREGKGFDRDDVLEPSPNWPPRDWKGVFLCAPAGSMIVRDVRAVHRGMVNATSRIRPLINMNVESTTQPVPYHWMTVRLERWAREKRARHLRERRLDAVMFWNSVGQGIMDAARSDRFDKRRIPRDVWSQLSPAARELLRYAEVEGTKTDAYRASRAIRPLLPVAEFLFGAVRGGRGPQSRQAPTAGEVDPSETKLIEILSKNEHTDEEDRFLREKMKESGRHIDDDAERGA